jgi:ankyrin repeat protein
MVSGDAGGGHARLPDRAARITVMANAGATRAVSWTVVATLAVLVSLAGSSYAQVAPSRDDIRAYTGLLAAAARGDAGQITQLIVTGARPDVRDAHGRTPLHVAAFGRHADAMRALVAGGADPNALENDRYDIVTIAAVADDPATLRVALALGASARNVTSRYDGTALIAAAHLGHAEVVGVLIAARAPLDHVNNLGWTALIESVVLGDGGARHTDTLRRLVEAGANVNLADRDGRTPRTLARARGYDGMVQILEQSGAR